MTETVAPLEEHRAALTGHCYRMLGSAVDADDAVQETMVRAWRSLDRFEGRASMRTWLYRIATNVCLDALAERGRRRRPQEGPVGTVAAALVAAPASEWVEPIPDAVAVPADGDPAERALLRESIRLAFVAALQHLPARQRAALLLADVLGWSAAEVADSLDTTVAAVNSALQRARATLANRDLRAAEPLSQTQQRLLERYVEAFHRYDVEALAALLHADATFSMPPYALWLRGPEPVRAWLAGRGAGCRGSRLLPTAACGSPAFGQYRACPEGGHRPWALVVLELAGDRIAGWTSFLDTATWFPRFGLPAAIDDASVPGSSASASVGGGR
ncbi:MAG TPA: sigma-70 family RNA polymerase sigma factor [Thermoanaerobaculia bacterium]|nr:sigma-70 family RNA polymerase sigma factor [Thermoanaerobaculia bacterium]